MKAYTDDGVPAVGRASYTAGAAASGRVIAARVGIVLAAAGLLTAGLYFSLKFIPAVGFMLAAMLVFVTWYALQFTKIEYAYTIEKGMLAVEKVYGARKAKAVGRYRLARLASARPFTADAEENAVFFCKKDDAFAYTLRFRGEEGGEGETLVLSLPDEMRKCVRYYNAGAFGA